MVTVDLRSLVGRMDDLCRRSLEAAAGLTLSRTHYNVEIEHWLLTLADRARARCRGECIGEPLLE